MVNRDADGAGLLARDAGLLELRQGEAAARANLGVVLVRGAANDRAQQAGGGARGDGGRLLRSAKQEVRHGGRHSSNGGREGQRTFWRVTRRAFLAAGWLKKDLTRVCHCFLKWAFTIWLLPFIGMAAGRGNGR